MDKLKFLNFIQVGIYVVNIVFAASWCYGYHYLEPKNNDAAWWSATAGVWMIVGFITQIQSISRFDKYKLASQNLIKVLIEECVNLGSKNITRMDTEDQEEE